MRHDPTTAAFYENRDGNRLPHASLFFPWILTGRRNPVGNRYTPKTMTLYQTKNRQ